MIYMNLDNAQSCPACGSSDADSSDWVSRSALVREAAAAKNEILRHKWFESERAGHDIGFDYALVDWMLHHRSGWDKRHGQGSQPA